MKIAVTKRVSPNSVAQQTQYTSSVIPPCGENSERASIGSGMQTGIVQLVRITAGHTEFKNKTASPSAVQVGTPQHLDVVHSSDRLSVIAALRMDSSGNTIPAAQSNSEPHQTGLLDGSLRKPSVVDIVPAPEVKLRVLGGSAFNTSSRSVECVPLQEGYAAADDVAYTDGDAQCEGEMEAAEGEDMKVVVTDFDDALDEVLADESAALERFECSECGIKFARHSALRQHARKAHATRIGVQCEVCGKSFRYLGSMPRHMMLHASIKPFVCSACGAQFAQKGDLRRHERLHTGERPFSCPECSATFNREYSLKKHLHVHTGERPYACTVCERRFSSRSSVTRHFHTHAHAHAAQATIGSYPEEDYVQQDSHGDAAEVELAGLQEENENVEAIEDDQVDEGFVAIVEDGAASSRSPPKRRYKQPMRSRAVATNDEVDSETLEAAWLLSSR